MISKEDIISTLYERNQSNGAFILDTEEFSKWKKQKSSNFEKLTNFISQKLDSNSKEEFDNIVDEYLEAEEACVAIYLENSYKVGFLDGLSIFRMF